MQLNINTLLGPKVDTLFLEHNKTMKQGLAAFHGFHIVSSVHRQSILS